MDGTTLRLRKAINWLIFQEVAENERALAERLGYTKSSFSQIVNGKVPLSDRFLKSLCALDENINDVWIRTGEGGLFKSGIHISQKVNGDHNQVAGRDMNVSGGDVGKLIETVSSQQKTITALVSANQAQTERILDLMDRLTREQK